MRGQHLAILAHGPAKREKLVLLGKGTGRIDQSERKARRTLFQLGGEQNAHFVDLGLVGWTPVVSHHRKPQGRVADERYDIERYPFTLQRVAISIEVAENLAIRRLAEQA